MTTEIALLSGEPFTEREIEIFEQKYLAVMQQLSDAVKAKKKLEADEKKIKSQLEKVMDEYGIKSLDNQFLKITRVSASEGKTTIDVDKLEEKEAELFNELLADYPKITGARKASIRFDAK